MDLSFNEHDILMNFVLDLYNAFLAPGSPCELNIDHSLRNALVSRMTRFELPDTELLSTANDIVQLYDQAQSSVFKLMASVSKIVSPHLHLPTDMS